MAEVTPESEAKLSGRLLAAAARAIAELQPVVEALNAAKHRYSDVAWEELLHLQRLEHRIATGEDEP